MLSKMYTKRPTRQRQSSQFTGCSPRQNPATTAGHPEGIKPKLGENTRAAKGGEGHPISEMIRT
jgi:hypothetical protein